MWNSETYSGKRPPASLIHHHGPLRSRLLSVIWTHFTIPANPFLEGTEKTPLCSSSSASAPLPSSPFILVQEHVPSMSTAVGSNLISSYLIDCPPSSPTGNPAAFLCRQENISLLINLSTGTRARAEAGKPISRSLARLHLFLLQQSFPSCGLPCFSTASPARLTVLRLGTLGTVCVPHSSS